MQKVNEDCGMDDDMVDGDLGFGMETRVPPSPIRRKTQSFLGFTDSVASRAERFRHNSQTSEALWFPGPKTTETQCRAQWRLSQSDSLVELSKEEMRARLQEASEVIDVLLSELEVAHRYLEGKYEALKILQGKAILDKATSHTKNLLQKTEERAKVLEKEVNSLQWELSFNQMQMKKSVQTLEQKYQRVLCENKILIETLEKREIEIQQLRTQNSALNQQCSELISILDVKEQRIYLETKPKYSQSRDASVLELAVLGACRCPGVAEACPCSRTAAATRKQLLQLQHELDAQSSRREEAVMVADAFRIAFEQQLRKRSEHFLLLAEANILKSHREKSEGVNRSPLVSVSDRLKGLLPSGLEVKMPDDLLEALYRLLDLLNDKEVALAHQKKVSLMLAHSADELQRKLHVDSHFLSTDPFLDNTLPDQNQQSSNLSENLEPSDLLENRQPSNLSGEPATIRSSREPANIRSTREPATIKSSGEPATIRSTREPATIEFCREPETMKSSIEPETIRSTREPPTIRSSREPPTIRSSREPPTIKSVRETATIKFSTEPATMKSSSEPATIEFSREPATIRSTRKPATIKSVREPATIKSTRETSNHLICLCPRTFNKSFREAELKTAKSF
uniref:Coiled-coil domain containing 125 n=1 Tax=Takifugu rubripes TaxID=31033 RepID=H2RXI5_TAKRU